MRGAPKRRRSEGLDAAVAARATVIVGVLLTAMTLLAAPGWATAYHVVPW